MFSLLQNYLIFLLVVFLFFYSSSNKIKPYIIFIASVFFLAAISLQFVLFAIIFTIINYLFSILLVYYSKNEDVKSKLFWSFIIFDILILIIFKFFAVLIPVKSIVIPIGISYYTFQSIGYLIRIDRGSEKVEKNVFHFASLLLFFPKILAGPIERSSHFFPQLSNITALNKVNIKQGVRLFLWGLFKKVVIADSLFQPLNSVYNSIHHYSGVQLLLIMLTQTIYIYNDFSGYTDMALGSAKILGFNLTDNFNRPFLAKSVGDYWRRWHISLSSWCNDFIYNPFIIKYRRWGNKASYFGIFVTFFIVGIWHGSNITYIILGLLQAIAIVYENLSKRYRIKIFASFNSNIINILSRLLVYLFMSASMIFFFSNTISDAYYFITHLFIKNQNSNDLFYFIDNKMRFSFSLFLFILFYIIEYKIENGIKINEKFLQLNIYLRWLIYTAAILLIFVSFDSANSFYYSRF